MKEAPGSLEGFNGMALGRLWQSRMGKILEDFKREQQQAVAQEEAFLQRIDEGGFSVDAEAHTELNRLERRAEALQELMELPLAKQASFGMWRFLADMSFGYRDRWI